MQFWEKAGVKTFLVLLLLLNLANMPATQAQVLVRQNHDVVDEGTHRIIVKLKDSYKAEFNRNLGAERLDSLSRRANMSLQMLRPMSGNAHVVSMPQILRGKSLNQTVERLRADPAVEYVYADTREHLVAVPTDPVFTSSQYYLKTPSTASGSITVSSINATSAWDITTGSSSVVVALIDSGVRFDHPDLAGQLLPGYDFVSADCSTDRTSPIYRSNCTSANQYTTANDGSARDVDASDPGDGAAAAEIVTNPFLSNCNSAGETSIWHGTHVAGIIGARANNGIGVAGINWNVRLLPVRVLGRCGGFQSDVVDGMRWAAGISVPGVPDNLNPARVLNISLGSVGVCGNSAYLQAIADVVAQGAIIVAAAGNDAAGLIRLANCGGVIAVGAVRADGLRTTYSNTGSSLTLMAPGGEVSSTGAGIGLIVSTNNAGTLGPVAYTSSGYYAQGAGTSFSAPMVTGTIALMLAVNPNLTSQNIQDILIQTARPFVTLAGSPTCVAGGGSSPNNTLPCNCTTAACGAGYLDAGLAVARVQAQVSPAALTSSAPVGSSGGGGGGGGGALDGLSLALFASLVLVCVWAHRGQYC